MAELLVDLGAEVEGIGTTTLRIRCREVTKDEPDEALVGRLRGSVLLLGPFWPGAVARSLRLREATFRRVAPSPRTSKRLVGMGSHRIDGPWPYRRVPGRLEADFDVSLRGVGHGHETALLAAAAAPGVTEIRHAACEPHVVELCLLQKMGGRHYRCGNEHHPGSRGGMKLQGASHTLWGDYIEAGSWAVVAPSPAGTSTCRASAGRHGSGRRRAEAHERAVPDGRRRTRVERSLPKVAGRITTGLWPGFPSDLISPSRCWRRRPVADARARLAV